MNDKILNQASVDFDYKIDPNGATLNSNIETNVVETNLILGNLSMVKSVDKTYATVGDILTYTINVSNIGNVLVSSVVFTDIVPSGATFVTGSVKVDNVAQPTYNPNLGFSLGSMLILASKTVEFQVEITSVPNPNTIINKATTTFNYLVIVPISGSSESNNVTTTINFMEVSAVKSANVEAVEPGDTIIYTVIIENESNIAISNVEFTDPLATEVTFITGSVEIDSVNYPTYNPDTGFVINNIAANTSVTINYSVTVN